MGNLLEINKVNTMAGGGTRYFSIAFAEFLFMFLILFVIHSTSQSPQGPFALFAVFLISVFVTANISGGQLNSAVSLLCWLNTRGVKENGGAVFLISAISQILGGTLGVLSAHWLDLPITNLLPFPKTTVGVAIFVEALFTFLLCIIVSHLTDPANPPKNTIIPSLLVPAVIFSQAIAIGRLTGGLINPSIALATVFANAILSGTEHFHNVWIYLVGAFLGAILAHFVYTYFLKSVFAPATRHKELEEEPEPVAAPAAAQ
eukprot:TRINITY_DN289_c0_g1_i1.p1 TRINITY_DN289_c0_g1~~TRINITY_DN289_c0_g1_i1.p1  ORF type:complete len:299 (+),score=92.72 TRINITY_DN289_c0_g1_i1:118-897(+)